MTTALALVHQRFSTNTFPSWQLAHPYRYVAHNGEINTLRGNVNWMAARQASVASDLFGEDIEKLWPISYEGQSDTACFDNALEFLVQGGYSLTHAMMMLIPGGLGRQSADGCRAQELLRVSRLDDGAMGRAQLQMAFTDGRQIGATLDRNGLRPARYLVTDDGLVVHGVGGRRAADPRGEDCPQVAPSAGQDAAGRPREGMHRLGCRHQEGAVRPPSLQEVGRSHAARAGGAEQRRGARHAGRRLVARSPAGVRLHAGGSQPPDDADGGDGRRSDRLDGHGHADLGDVVEVEAALLVLPAELRAGDQPADRSDPRGARYEPRLVHRAAAEPARPSSGNSKKKRLEVRQPILTNEDLEKIRSIGTFEDSFDTKTLDITYASQSGAEGMAAALDRLCTRADQAVSGGYNIIILSDRLVGADRIPIPALLATAAVHHHLIRTGLRTSVGLVRRDGRGARGASFRAARRLRCRGHQPLPGLRDAGLDGQDRSRRRSTRRKAIAQYIKAIGKGLLKVMSKMGISTYQSYCGAQIFDAVGPCGEPSSSSIFTGTSRRASAASA